MANGAGQREAHMPERSRLLSIFLANEGTADDDLLEHPQQTTITSINVGGVIGTLYTISNPASPPRWASFFAEAIDVQALDLQTASASAVLALRLNGRLFAVTFGYGRHLLNPLVIESSFGLRVTLNAVAADKIRSIDKKAFEGISTHTREQASKDTSIGDFGLDVERDVLRAVVGKPSDPTLGTRLAGMDALTATCKLSLDDLPDLLRAYLAKSLETTYKQKYPWVDNIREVREKRLKKRLDEELLNVLGEADNPKAWLAVPDLVDWNDIDGFKYSAAKSAVLFPDLHLRDYLDKVLKKAPSIDMLRSQRVYGIRATSNQPFDKWPVYRCLYAEVTLDKRTYLLTGGAWYSVDLDFMNMINAAVNAIPQTNFVPLDYTEGDDEADYNKKLATFLAGACCLDGQTIQYGGGRSKVELCDVISPSRQLLHVKRYAGSSVLSHLFAQGVVSATSFIRDAAFRAKANQLLPTELRLADPNVQPNASDYEVAYVIASRSAKPLTPASLPFFSRVTLRNAHLTLASMGFKVTLTKAQIRS
jgi:uncharacterized protein (TIGR04141 family)